MKLGRNSVLYLIVSVLTIGVLLCACSDDDTKNTPAGPSARGTGKR